jgi:hypothetical protein
LRREIYFGQSIGNRFLDSFEPGKLIQPPFPFFGLDGSQPLICALLFCETWNATQRCNSKYDGNFHMKWSTIAGEAPALQFIGDQSFGEAPLQRTRSDGQAFKPGRRGDRSPD